MPLKKRKWATCLPYFVTVAVHVSVVVLCNRRYMCILYFRFQHSSKCIFYCFFYAGKLGYVQYFIISSVNGLYFSKIFDLENEKIDIHRLLLGKLTMALVKTFASHIYIFFIYKCIVLKARYFKMMTPL